MKERRFPCASRFSRFGRSKERRIEKNASLSETVDFFLLIYLRYNWQNREGILIKGIHCDCLCNALLGNLCATTRKWNYDCNTYKGKNGRSRCQDNDCYLCLCYHCLVRSFDGRTEMCILSGSEIKIFFFCI